MFDDLFFTNVNGLCNLELLENIRLGRSPQNTSRRLRIMLETRTSRLRKTMIMMEMKTQVLRSGMSLVRAMMT